MSASLKEQLLKLGLGSDKQSDRKPRARDARPPRPAPPASTAKSVPGGASAQSAASAAPAKSAPSGNAPSMRQQRELERERARRQARVRERIEAHKLDDPQAEIRHYYPAGRKIKSVYVTEAQQAALLRGEIVIAVAQGKGRLVPAAIVPSLREIDPEARIVDQSALAQNDADPAHQVPDDLRW